MGLGDFFPDDFKAEFASRNLEIGTVLRLSVKDTNPPKIKRFIIIGKTVDGLSLASLYINSEINTNVNWCIELQILQILIKKEGNIFLDRDSYVDCSKMIIRDTIEISHIIKENPASVLGKLNNSDLISILNTVKDSPTIKGRLKKKFGFFE